jgi:hypothetical protein
VSAGLVGAAAVLSLFAAAAIVWLLLADPGAIADMVSDRRLSALVAPVTQALAAALGAILDTSAPAEGGEPQHLGESIAGGPGTEYAGPLLLVAAGLTLGRRVLARDRGNTAAAVARKGSDGD